ncbi:MAG: hypothetical protein GX781_08180 [Clostridiales bacterium]|nr:hypothetical protein [Clostridiales bacterium]
MATLQELDNKIKIADAKIEKYKGWIARLNEEKKALSAQKQKMTSAKTKNSTAAVKKSAAAKTSVKAVAAKKAGAKNLALKRKPLAKAEPSLLEGVLEEVKKAGFDPTALIDSLLGKK